MNRMNDWELIVVFKKISGFVKRQMTVCDCDEERYPRLEL